ncbi:SMI1/KNR4 family protein [Deinococcus radiophilus]|uniref:SMI1/KNR4 family protein n=1 Tax=Deinococcus radiophilus TaxID=32062 RepID=A0A431W3D2_9DEIO|nr:SMI1/KNR4 family protein [Deinococcus radiophilus]RTR29892.1 SMI1/KNR4 family protein [Deinococcus radiophilus]UFA49755.1 SMI1/KNR4 family protein [Deinococcus radiophilus]
MSAELTPAEQVRRAGLAVNPPVTQAAFDALEDVWGVELPQELHTLYCDHDGQPEGKGVAMPFRLLSVSEAIAAHEEMTLDVPLLDDLPDLQQGIVVLWGDVGGNFMVYFLRGARRGMVGELHHEIPWSIAPQWRSLENFYAAMIEAAQDKEYCYPTDFPNQGPADTQQLAAFAEAKAALAEAQTAYEYDYWSANLLKLCPVGESPALLPLLTPLVEEGSYASTHVPFATEKLMSELGAAAMPYLREALASNLEQGIF